ncbi:MAG: nitrite/sulfite reductase [Myxococcales bacterium]|nr:nitrite/sulfite reductase [Myxococcales bacterium]
MYRYNEIDQTIVNQRVNEFRNQVARRLAGELSEDEFRPLRLMNGLYLQRHAYMLRISIPYGVLNSTQMRKLGFLSERYDRGFGHFTTRQNLQFNWIKLEEMPDILQHLADVEMHALQTSGNCVRNITSDPLAGIAADEIVDVRPYCEVLRQHFTLHPEFLYLPRKFKFAVSGAQEDRAAIAIHDIGVRAVRKDGKLGFVVMAGGGLGRTPRIGQVVNGFVAPEDLIAYCEAILRVYNLHGRRDNKFKARIKILVGELGIAEFREQVEAEFALIRDRLKLDLSRIDTIAKSFEDVTFEPDAATWVHHLERAKTDLGFARWLKYNTRSHRVPGYNVVYLSLKRRGVPPGDLFTPEFYAIADLMDQYNQGYCSTTYNQNLLLQYIRNADLEPLYDALTALNLATPNIGTINDVICCPGLDYCSLANSSSIPIATALNERYQDLDEIYEIGPLEIKMSGCINACGHHHAGHIGLLGINKKDEEYYQIAIGGSPGTTDDDFAAVGTILGPAVHQDDVVTVVDRIVDCYLERRVGQETFLQTVRRIGVDPFKEHAYAN